MTFIHSTYQENNLNYLFYSNDNVDKIPKDLEEVIKIFKDNYNSIKSCNNSEKKSNEILKELETSFELLNYLVEKDKKNQNQIKIKLDNNTENLRSFNVDALNIKKGIIVEIEAGRAVANNQFLKDIMECSIISSKRSVYINEKLTTFNDNLYLVVAVKNKYKIKNYPPFHDYNSISKWLNSFNNSNIKLNLKGILLIGY